jgi:hypothetical protein
MGRQLTIDQVDAEPEWPFNDSLPVSRPDLSRVPLDENVAIYDEVGHLLIMLNSSALAVLDFCDGASTFEQIVEELAAQHSGQIEIIRNDAWQTLRKLASLNLVADAR